MHPHVARDRVKDMSDPVPQLPLSPSDDGELRRSVIFGAVLIAIGIVAIVLVLGIFGCTEQLPIPAR